jgi:uncharacterized glyoxalase superfamily protein PhnB
MEKLSGPSPAIELAAAIPILRMFDVAKAREFYLGFLGFTVDFEARFTDEAPLFMGISRSGASLFLSEHHGDGTPGTHAVIDTNQVDALHAELIAKNYRYMRPHLEDQSWGSHEFTVIDPFNNRLTFRQLTQRGLG